MPEQPTPPDYIPGDGEEWPPTPLHNPVPPRAGQDDDDTPQDSVPPTQAFPHLPNFTAETRWGTMNLGVRRLLRFEVEGLAQQVCVEMFDMLLLGRGEQDNVQLALDLNPYGGYWHGVSRQHALILMDDGVLKLMDLASTNGTFLNGSLLPPHQLRILRDGDRIALSRLIMTIHFD